MSEIEKTVLPQELSTTDNLIPDIQVPVGKMVCRKCGRIKDEKKGFFMRKDHTRENLCKECMTQHIVNTDRTSFEWILELFDVPYIQSEWVKIYNKVLADKGVVGCDDVLGKYLRQMKIVQYAKYGYADTEQLEFKTNKERQDIIARQVAADASKSAELLKLQQQLDAGEISQAQFDTLSPLTANYDFDEPTFNEVPKDLDEEAILKDLEEEEIKMLRIKWGSNYKPSQWVRMEEIYAKYENEYELNVDREETLKQICKLTIKMDEALDLGDVSSYKSLSAAYDTLRKSSKFTEAQNKENSSRYLDSIGELVAFCEREGGIIEHLPNPDEYPQDKIDFTIKDLKAYNRNLVVNELGLGDLIESYIKKLEEAEKAKQEGLDSGLYLSIEDELADAITEQEAEDFQMYLENEIEDEATKLLEMLGD